MDFWFHVDDMGGLNRAKYSHVVPEWFAQHPGHFWDGYFLATLLYYWNLGPILTKQHFRRKHAHHQVDFKSAMGKMTRGSVGTFHVFGQKVCLLLQKQLKSECSKGTPYFSNYCLINSFFHEQLLWQRVYIFSYMQALGSSGISQFLFHEITRSWHTHTHQTIRLDELVWTEQDSARVMETFVEFSINMFENLVFWTKCD